MLNENYNPAPIEPKENRPENDLLPDITLADQIALEFSERNLPKIDYYSFDYDNTVRDELRGEYEEKRFYHKIRIPANFTLDPKQKTLTAFGIEHKRDLELHIAAAVLKKYNLNPKIGDMVWIHDACYRVTEHDKENFFAGSTQPMNYVLFAVKTNLNEYPPEARSDHKDEIEIWPRTE